MKLQPSLVDEQRRLAGIICEYNWLFNVDPKARKQPWHFFTGPPFGFRGESRKQRHERFLVYRGEDKKSLKIQEAQDRARAAVERAHIIRAQRLAKNGGEE